MSERIGAGSDRRKLLLDLSKNPGAALDYEIAQEMASALGRLGRTLEQALAALAEFDAGRAGAPLAADDRDMRRDLVAKAGVALWHFLVQRESCGLRDARQVIREYRVPAEVQHRTGVFPPPRRARQP